MNGRKGGIVGLMLFEFVSSINYRSKPIKNSLEKNMLHIVVNRNDPTFSEKTLSSGKASSGAGLPTTLS
jgi:hypothetical protein